MRLRVLLLLLASILYVAAQAKLPRSKKSTRNKNCSVPEGGSCQGSACCDKGLSPRVFCYRPEWTCRHLSYIRRDRRRRRGRQRRPHQRPLHSRHRPKPGPKGPIVQRPVDSFGREISPSECALGEGRRCQSTRGKTLEAYCACAEGLTCLPSPSEAETNSGRPIKRCRRRGERRRGVEQRPIVPGSAESASPERLEIASCTLGLGKGPCHGRAKTMGAFCGCGHGLVCAPSNETRRDRRSGRQRAVRKCAWDEETPMSEVLRETRMEYARAGEDPDGNPAPPVQRPLAPRLLTRGGGEEEEEEIPIQPQRPLSSQPGNLRREIVSCTLGEGMECDGWRGKTMASFCSGCGDGLKCAPVTGETRRRRGGGREPMRRCLADAASGVPPQQGIRSVLAGSEEELPIEQRPIKG